jgi:hypothetical protein
MASQPEDGDSRDLRNFGVLPHEYTLSQPEDVGSKDLRNVGILPHQYTVSQPIAVKASCLEFAATHPQFPLQNAGFSITTLGMCFFYNKTHSS